MMKEYERILGIIIEAGKDSGRKKDMKHPCVTLRHIPDCIIGTHLCATAQASVIIRGIRRKKGNTKEYL